MKGPSAIILALGGKGKGMGMKPKHGDMPMPKSEPSDDYRQLFIDAAKDGDWEAAFDAVAAHCMGEGMAEADDEDESEE